MPERNPCRQCGSYLIEVIRQGATRLVCSTCGMPDDANLVHDRTRGRVVQVELTSVSGTTQPETQPARRGGKRRE